MKLSVESYRFLKYCMVGLANTLLTLLVIYVCKSFLGIDPYLSNALGYAAGVINSFIWNRAWVFRSHGAAHWEIIRFLIGFGICYALQFAFVWSISSTPFGEKEFYLGFMTLSGYGIATLGGNVLYTACNFLYNRIVTFRSAR